MNGRQLPAIAAFLFAGTLAAACTPWSETDDLLPLEFTRNLDKWQSSDVGSYSAQIQALCECDTRPVQVSVDHGTIALATFEPGDPSSLLSDAEQKKRVLSIEQLFEAISAAYSSDFDRVEVEYDDAYGFPIEVLMDPSNLITDDETRYMLSVISMWFGKNDVPPSEELLRGEPVTLDAIVRYTGLEMGCWFLDTRYGNLEATNLDTSWQIDGLRAVARVRVRNELLGGCMIGPIVTIDFIDRGSAPE